jgi:transposase
MEQNPKARRGYSRDSRPDCLQVGIALVVTPDGFPLACEVMDGNTSEDKTLKPFLERIENTYGKARRVWVMDRGNPTEATLSYMREPGRDMYYLVDTPKGRINKDEKKWLELPWQQVRESVQVKLYEHEGEIYVLARSQGRQSKENAMSRKRLARLLRKLRAMRRSLRAAINCYYKSARRRKKLTASLALSTSAFRRRKRQSRAAPSVLPWTGKNPVRPSSATDITCCVRT